MPEGPQVRRAGNLIADKIGASIICITHPPSRKAWDLSLPVRIDEVDVVGKNIFIHLANGKVIYNHMLMWGSWRAGCDIPGRKRLNTCFQTDQGSLGYYGGGVLKLVSASEAADLKAKLGPDMLLARTAQIAFERLEGSDLPLGEALLAQNLVAGIGNIYKSEGMFVARLSPFMKARDLTERDRQKLFDFLKPQMTGDVVRRSIITTTPQAARAGNRRFVYRRWHQHCLFCGTKIERVYQGKLTRSTYFCPNCQKVDLAGVL